MVGNFFVFFLWIGRRIGVVSVLRMLLSNGENLDNFKNVFDLRGLGMINYN